MKAPNHWRDSWQEVSTKVSSVDYANSPREKRGTALTYSWPLILVLLQGAVWAPLFGSGLLSSPFGGDGGAQFLAGDLTPVVTQPEIAVEQQATEETPQEDKPGESTPTPGASAPGATPAPSPTPGAPGEPRQEPGSTPEERGTTPGTPRQGAPEYRGTPRQNPPRKGQPAVTPDPVIPEKVSVILRPGRPSNTINLSDVPHVPGEIGGEVLEIVNDGNTPLTNFRLVVNSSEALFAEREQGLDFFAWGCSGAWSGTLEKPICNGSILGTSNFKVAQREGPLPIGTLEPQASLNVLVAYRLPENADNRFQGQKTNLTMVVKATQAGGAKQ